MFKNRPLKKFFPIAAIIIVAVVCTMIMLPNEQAQNPRFVLNDNNISSWQEGEDQFLITLTQDGQDDIFKLTRQNVNKPLELYVKDLFVSSPIIRMPIDGPNMALATDKEIHKQILSLLPPEKMTVESE